MNRAFGSIRWMVLLLIAALLLLWGASFWPDTFFRGYWFGLMFWTQLSLGALIVLLLYYLTGGEWGRATSPLLLACGNGFFFLLPFFIPVFFVLPHIFSWTQIEPGISAPMLVNKLAWLNSPAFIIRSLVYLVLFGILIGLRRRNFLTEFAGPSLVLALILISFGSVDWMMSLQPTFYSSLYPFIYFAGAMVSTFALLSASAAWLQLRGAMPERPELLLALGQLLFTAVFFWGYITFCQFIIIWTGNLPDEAEWYVVRSEPVWLWFTILVISGHFVFPFGYLLSQETKKNPRRLLGISLFLLGMHLLEVFWLMRPTPGEGFQLSFFDLLLPLFFGLGWFRFVLGSCELYLPPPQEISREI